MSAEDVHIDSQKMVESAIRMIAESTSGLQQDPDGESWRWPWNVIGVQLGCHGMITLKFDADGTLKEFFPEEGKAGKASNKKKKGKKTRRMPSYSRLWEEAKSQGKALGSPFPDKYVSAMLFLIYLRDEFEHMDPAEPVEESLHDLIETCLSCIILMEELLRYHPVWESPEKQQEMQGLLSQAQDNLCAMYAASPRSGTLDLPPIPFPTGKPRD